MLPKRPGGHISTEFIKIILIFLKVEHSHKTKTGLLQMLTAAGVKMEWIIGQ